ncbi:MAG: GldG family protein [Armatimonadetes bacterium]|nr:GldG family protein [Armatimonadota bacterium]
MADESNNLPAESAGSGKSTLIGVALLVVTIIALGWLAYNRINGSPWKKVLDTALAVVGALGLAGALAVWWDPIAKALASRGVMNQANAGLITLLVLGILILVNVVAERRLGWIKGDWTKEKFYSLSDQSVKLVKSITKENPVEIHGFVVQDAYHRERGVQEELLQEYGRLNPNVTIKVSDPNVNLAERKVAQDAHITTAPSAVIRFKNNPTQFETVSGADEKDITRGLLKLLTPSSRKVYFLTGHGECQTSESKQDGLSSFKQVLEEERYTTADLALLTSPEVPTDAAVVVAVWPKRPFAPDELRKLSDWMAKGGRLFACLDPDAKSNLQEVIAKYGLDFQAAVISDNEAKVTAEDARYFQAVDYGTSEITDAVKNRRMPVIFARAGYFNKGVADPKLEVTELIKSQAAATAETQAAPPPPAPPAAPGQPAPPPPPKPATQTTNGPFTVAWAVGTKDAEPEKEG